MLFRFFFIFATFTLAIFFFGVAERFFLSKIGILEFPILLLFLHFGGLFAIRMNTFIDLLIALEIVTLASYVFVTFERQNRFSTYAGVQYFILGSLPSARLLLGFGLFYLQAGTIALQDLDIFFNTVYSLKNAYIDITPSMLITFMDNFSDKSAIEDVLGQNQINFDSLIYSQFSFENIAASINPINALSVIAVCFLFFNFFFKVTAAPFHI